MHQTWWYVYVLQSKKNGKWYIGSTKNYKKRISSHNEGKNKSTKPHLPWKLLYMEISLNQKDARAREKYLKSGMGWKYLKNRMKFFFFSGFVTCREDSKPDSVLAVIYLCPKNLDTFGSALYRYLGCSGWDCHVSLLLVSVALKSGRFQTCFCAHM
ncbi:MAG TPA: GIY-YIG nuclease family protein [Patescibacteria group bacterium]|nr:GIY-YIG nuclease family protein [Patescibacteria group bacterium]